MQIKKEQDLAILRSAHAAHGSGESLVANPVYGRRIKYTVRKSVSDVQPEAAAREEAAQETASRIGITSRRR